MGRCTNRSLALNRIRALTTSRGSYLIVLIEPGASIQGFTVCWYVRLVNYY